MPELPEVETIARQLKPLLCGRKVRAVEILDPKLSLDHPEELRGLVIRDVYRIGKEVAIEFYHPQKKHEPLWLCVHLRMTGRLIFHESSDTQTEKHLRALFKLDRGILYFYDTRRFGILRLCRSQEEIKPTGLDPRSKEFTARALKNLLSGSRQEIKPWLLRQDRLVGLGNIYASEILFYAGIDPRRPAGTLEHDEITSLHAATRAVLKQAIQHCGTTFSDYQDAGGRQGSFQNFLKVYARDGQTCRDCGNIIQKSTQQQRSTFYCSVCQGK